MRKNARRVTRWLVRMTKFAVIQFPGSNCDQDCLAALRGLAVGMPAVASLLPGIRIYANEIQLSNSR